MRKVMIIGIKHEFHDPKSCFPVWRRQFLERLREHCQRENVTLILEEARWGHPTVTETLCEQLKSASDTQAGQISYHNIEMPPEHRLELGIPPMYALDLDGSGPHPQKAHFHAMRENFMVRKVLDAARIHRTEGTLLVLCGEEHMEPLRSALSCAGELFVSADSWCLLIQ